MVNDQTSQEDSFNSDDLQSVNMISSIIDEDLNNNIKTPQTCWDSFDCFKLFFCCGIFCTDEED